MKKVSIFVLLCMLGFCGCSTEQEFSLTAEQRQNYQVQMEQIADEYYWSFDGDSLQFGSAQIPEDTQEESSFFNAMDDIKTGMSAYAGKMAVLGMAKLLHYNGDLAGQLLCYFQNDALIGVCYQSAYDNDYYSLQQRNPFFIDNPFTKYETWNGMSTAFEATGASFPSMGFVSVGRDADGTVLTACIQDGTVRIYQYKSNALRLWKTLTFSNGLQATAATFFDGTNGSELAVLLSSSTLQGEGEGAHTYTLSEKIVFYDTNMQRTQTELMLADQQVRALANEGSRLLVASDQIVQYYDLGAAGWERTGSSRLKHGVDYIHITDLDSDGTKEYIISDGMDLYVYQKNADVFRAIWSTHLGVESLYGPITSGDLNRDGVKEIYVCDMTGTTIRYIVTEQGIRSSNEDIVYGQCIYPCDLNHDGLDDYWLVTDIESKKGSLCMAIS